MGIDPVTLMAGSALISGVMGADAASSAADAQLGASREATASQRAMFDKQTALEAPFRTAGIGALSKLSDLLGTSGQTGGFGSQQVDENDPLWKNIVADYQQKHREKYGTDPTTDFNAGPDERALRQNMESLYWQGKQSQGQVPGGASSADYGSLLKPFGMSDFSLDPGVQFQMQQGSQALQNSQAAKDGILSGGALKDLMSFNQGLAGTGYQSAFDRYMAGKQFTLGSLMGVGGMGQAAASNTANNGSSIANGIAGTITGGGNAQAAGTIGTANALSGGLGGAGNAYFLSSLLGKNGSVPGTPTPGASMPVPAEFNQA